MEEQELQPNKPTPSIPQPTQPQPQPSDSTPQLPTVAPTPIVPGPMPLINGPQLQPAGAAAQQPAQIASTGSPASGEPSKRLRALRRWWQKRHPSKLAKLSTLLQHFHAKPQVGAAAPVGGETSAEGDTAGCLLARGWTAGSWPGGYPCTLAGSNVNTPPEPPAPPAAGHQGTQPMTNPALLFGPPLPARQHSPLPRGPALGCHDS